MLRFIPQRRSIALGIRYYSAHSKAAPAKPLSLHQTIKEAIPKVVEAKAVIDLLEHHGKQIDTMSLAEREKKAFEVYELARVVIKKLRELSPSPEEEKTILNSLIKKFSKVNYGIAIMALKELENYKKTKATKEGKKEGKSVAPLLEAAAFAELLKHNPGRVSSSAEIYDKHMKEHHYEGDLLKLILLNKLVHGDKAEKLEGEAAAKLTVPKAIKVFELLEDLTDKKATKPETIEKIAEDLLSIGLGKALPELEIPALLAQKILDKKHEKKEEVSHEDLFHLLSSVKNHEGGLDKIPSELLLKSFMAISGLQNKENTPTENFAKFDEQLKQHRKKSGKKAKKHGLAGPKELAKDVSEEIIKRKLDKDAPVMLDLVRAAGFDSADLTRANELFQKYQTQIPENHPAQSKLKSLLSLAFIYNSIKNNDDKYEEIAKVLVPQNPKPASENLASFVLHQGWFGKADEALDTYNRALNLFMDPKDDPENTKARGQLVQSLILTTLLGDEVGLARFIQEKAKENELTDEKYENKIKQIMKTFGDKKEEHIKEEKEEREKNMRGEMKKLMLLAMLDLAPRIEQAGLNAEDVKPVLDAAKSDAQAIEGDVEAKAKAQAAKLAQFAAAAVKAREAEKKEN